MSTRQKVRARGKGENPRKKVTHAYTVVSAGPHMLRMPTSEGHWRANRRAECRLTPASDARDASKTRPKAPLSTGAQPLEGPVRHRYRCVRASRELPEDD